MTDDLDELGGGDVGEGERGGVERVDGGADEYACDVDGCGRTFESAASLGMHRWAAHKIRGRGRDKKSASGSGGDGRTNEGTPRRNTPPQSQSKRARLVSETATELADLIDSARGRLIADGLTIADTIRRDADRMGEALAGLAGRNLFGLGSLVGALIDNLFGSGGPLSLLTAFGPTLRKTLDARPRREPDELAAMQAEFNRMYEQDGPEVAHAWAIEQGLVVSGGDGAGI
jgi:hypothetical protein